MRPVLLTLCLVACAACARGGPPRAEGGAARVLPNGVGAAYLRVTNPTGTADVLVSATSPLATRAELHEVVASADGVLRMEARPDGLAVPARGALALVPGGAHVMLYGVALPPGATELPLTLHLARAGALDVRLPVRGPGEELP